MGTLGSGRLCLGYARPPVVHRYHASGGSQSPTSTNSLGWSNSSTTSFLPDDFDFPIAIAGSIKLAEGTA